MLDHEGNPIIKMELDNHPILDLWEDYNFLEIMDNYFDIEDQIKSPSYGYFKINKSSFKKLKKDWEKGKYDDKLTSTEKERFSSIIHEISGIYKKNGFSKTNFNAGYFEKSGTLMFYYEISSDKSSIIDYAFIKEFDLKNKHSLSLKDLDSFSKREGRLIPYYIHIPLLKELVAKKIDNIEDFSKIVQKSPGINSIYQPSFWKPDKEVMMIYFSYTVFHSLEESNYIPQSPKAYFINHLEIMDDEVDLFSPISAVYDNNSIYCEKKYPPRPEYGFEAIDLGCFKKFYNALKNNPELKNRYESEYRNGFCDNIEKINILVENKQILIKNNKILFYF
ncbi:hypothetical protein HYG87_00585 [Methanobacterium alkalithermotolerans]|uniref:Uncharacterized protein n=1 Tax=Methanobacterium alkalithermotolerans TaxID=2731220 RepID=A0A8T8K4G9_9EURY|nr:hypothetical protein [Methanobacterium alkalithermotolerans]QUH22365.1 hypothetical protein HYG87_00585 [Methanobacterium alkalithermotolerans]